MSNPPPSDSSLDSFDMDSRHSCPSCNSRMSSLLSDQHKLCVNCHGQDCDSSNKCVECSSWADDVFEKYVKYRRSLISKSKSKKLKGSMKDLSGKLPCKSLGNKSQDESAVGDSSVAQSTNLSEDRVRELISSSLMDFSSSFASSMEESFAKINSLVDSKLSAQENISQDATNFSFSGESPLYRSDSLLAQSDRIRPSLTPSRTSGLGAKLWSRCKVLVPFPLICVRGLRVCELQGFVSLNQS